MGARLNTSAGGIFATGLTKHQNGILELMSEILLHPSFPEEEFVKIKKQLISGLQTQKDNPNAIANNVASVLRYGKDHPYGEMTTEETVEKVTLDDCKAYYETYFKPNKAYLVIVGDITNDSAKMLAEKYFGNWKKGPVPNLTYDMPEQPDNTKVAFVHKPGAVQSVINITYPISLKPGSEDVIPASLMNTILGGGSGARLYENLREDKGFTYGAYSSVSPDRLVGSFNCSASVRNEVTDSSVTEFIYELNRLSEEGATREELAMMKNYMSGSFARSLESPQTIARFALNTIRYNYAPDYFETYLQKLNAVTLNDIKRVAQKYIKPENAHILVVGNKNEVAEKLTGFSSNGVIDYYDSYGNYLEPVDEGDKPQISVGQILSNYIEALGGSEKLRSINSVSKEMSMDIMGQTASITMVQAKGNKSYMNMNMQGQSMMKQVCDGTRAMISQMGSSQEVEGDDLKDMIFKSAMFPELNLADYGVVAKMIGMTNLAGTRAYEVEYKNPNGSTSSMYFDITNFRLLKEVSVQEANGQTQTITTEYGDYTEVDGVWFPYTITTTGAAPFPMKMTTRSIKLNSEPDTDIFKIN